MSPTQPLHATTLARHGPGGWRGVLIQGPSGIGKSDLGLRLIAQGWRLVADDWTTVWASQGQLYATAPERITGLMEIRGLGICSHPLSQPLRALCRLSLAVTCTHEAVERLPVSEEWRFQGVVIAHLTLDPRPASASLLLDAAFAAL